MVICYSGKSAISAQKIAECDDEIEARRSNFGDINWGREIARTRLNPDISNSTNKRRMRELFDQNDVPIPPPITETDFEEPEFISWPIVGRPDTHTRKRGFWLCRNMRDVEKARRGTRRKKAATHFMEWVDAPREYRVHIFRGKSLRISEKVFNSDRTDYTTGRPRHEVKHVRKAAKKAVKALGLDFGAVDVLANDTECWVLEVNTAPGVGGTMPQIYADAFKEYMEEV